ncbi:Transcription factor PRE5 [Capsicum baccatum]|uniref:Transcription factor ILI5 n=2 Tax=Capsicum TaxID=4071 RepID=A0A1U8GHR8_CAPAN|nr:transcription factor PRE3 [Capsicum annuum]PHT53818.1 Transcription factor PRE5 [Capsicum baccatum]PHU23772.1 Transcription factor PRE5 [Capsicum chinense]KAF3669615.1 Transcription factor ILI5 [Capsicum annuum]KAF3671867.1 Transcription factor ILI5 [Capsicum annuum]PHT88054.1 Transcription factor ILI5 [Capsicum annuum]
MSSRRRSNNSRFTQDEINDLVLKLQSLLPNSSSRCTSRASSSSKILEETCNYIRKLHSEVDDLSEKLSQVLDSADTNTVDLVDTLLTLLQQ